MPAKAATTPPPPTPQGFLPVPLGAPCGFSADQSSQHNAAVVAVLSELPPERRCQPGTATGVSPQLRPFVIAALEPSVRGGTAVTAQRMCPRSAQGDKEEAEGAKRGFGGAGGDLRGTEGLESIGDPRGGGSR